MDEIVELRRRVELLESREAVREAMHRYWRVLDYKQWEELEDWVTLNGVTIMKGFGKYDMRFRRGPDGVWRIAKLRLLHDYREEFPRWIDGRRVATTPALDGG